MGGRRAHSASGTLCRRSARRFDTILVNHQNSVMRNLTITVEEEVARWARIRAAEREMSVSRLVGAMLKEKMVSEEGYKGAREQFFSVQPRRLREPGKALPSRDTLHDRAALR